jgi:Flp pilus assembly protein TadG
MSRLRHKAIELLSRFGADRTGATAVEFALVAFPFFSLLFAIIQTSLVMFGGQALQAMTSSGARKIMTGEAKGQTFADFKKAMCSAGGLSGMFNCDKLFIQVQSFENFGDASAAPVLNSKCFTLTPPPTAGDCFKPGTGKDVVIIRVAYDWPFAVSLEDMSHSTRIAAVAAFRNEPF